MSFRKDFMYPFKDLVTLMRRMDNTLYMIASEMELSDPKCPYCDDHRMITLSAPNGQSMTIPCKCGENKHKVYYVIPCRALSMTLEEMAVEFRYEYGQRRYVRRHDSIVDPALNDKRLKSTNYIGMSFTSIEKAKDFIESQGWPYSQQLTDEAIANAEKGFRAEVNEKLRPVTPDEKLREKYAKNGIIIKDTYYDTDPDPTQTYQPPEIQENAIVPPEGKHTESTISSAEKVIGEEKQTGESNIQESDKTLVQKNPLQESDGEDIESCIKEDDDGSWWD